MRALYTTSLGETRAAVMSCPHCSYLVEGNCVICEDGDPHPACQGCVGGRLPAKPWWQSELAIAIATATVVSVASAIIMRQLQKKTGI